MHWSSRRLRSRQYCLRLRPGRVIQEINDPKDDDGPEIREWVCYGGAEQAEDSNEKGDKK